MEPTSATAQEEARRHLFYQTSHSPSLAELVGYERAKSILDFCFIANPYYPTPAMLKNLQDHLPNLIKSYPSSKPEANQANLAAVLHVNPEHLLIGNGATELIALMNEMIVKHIAVPVPTFGEYIEKLNDQRDAELYTLKAENGYQLELGAYLRWVRERGIQSALVINPGNPTGQLHSQDDMERFLNDARDLELVVVDESFIDFAADAVPSLLPRAERYSNLVVVRSMSKHCGVPGLRLGYCYSGNLYLLNKLRRLLPTWNVNTVAEYFLSLLPATDAEYHKGRRRLIADVRALYDALTQVPGLHVYPTGANFLLVKILDGRTAQEIQMRLLEDHGMYVRDCSNKIGMDAFHIRIASQGRDKDAKLVQALRALFAKTSSPR